MSAPAAAEGSQAERGSYESEPGELEPPRRGTAFLWRAGRTGWAALGVIAILAVIGYLASQVSLVVVPVVLALFPATLLWPLASFLKRHRFPGALAALTSILAALLLFAAVIGALVALVQAELPALMRSAAEGISALDDWLESEPFGLEVGGLRELLSAAQAQLGEVSDLAPAALSAATTAFETVVSIVLLIVVLFFYLKDGPRLSEGIIRVLPDDMQDRVRGAAARAWNTLGSYFRWLLVVALVDAVLIGIGLFALQVPLALPLSVLVFFGGLFPIVGAIVTGALAVLVALADAGLGVGLAVLGIVVFVQQLEGNVLHPFVQSRAIKLHALIVVLSVTAGGILLGILGAFLAVPVAAIVASTLRYLRSDGEEARKTPGEAAAERKGEAEAAAEHEAPEPKSEPSQRGGDEAERAGSEAPRA
jgi:putative heme transporter